MTQVLKYEDAVRAKQVIIDRALIIVGCGIVGLTGWIGYLLGGLL